VKARCRRKARPDASAILGTAGQVALLERRKLWRRPESNADPHASKSLIRPLNPVPGLVWLIRRHDGIAADAEKYLYQPVPRALHMGIREAPAHHRLSRSPVVASDLGHGCHEGRAFRARARRALDVARCENRDRRSRRGPCFSRSVAGFGLTSATALDLYQQHGAAPKPASRRH